MTDSTPKPKTTLKPKVSSKEKSLATENAALKTRVQELEAGLRNVQRNRDRVQAENRTLRDARLGKK